ncbi:MAG: 8-oxo-dGTP diphosphatase [Psychroserpens sp.]|jgi:8-oxo-dGTP diphosphatase
MLKTEIQQFYGNKIRVRVCGVLVVNEKVLLLKHEGIGGLGFFWNTPGGEPEKDENMKAALIREFKEETNLKISVGSFLCMNEFIAPPLHAVEYYFEVRSDHGDAKLGYDPENVTVLTEIKWFSKNQFNSLPAASKPSFLLNYINFG